MLKIGKKHIALLLTTAIVLSPVSGALANELDQINQRKSEITNANESIQNQRREIEKANLSLEEAYKKLETLNSDMKVIKGEIDSLKKEIDEINSRIKENEGKKKELEEKLGKQVELFKGRLDVMYKNRKTGYIPVLLSSDDVSDFLSKLETMKSVAEYDKNLISKMKETKTELDLLLVNLKGQKTSRDVAMESLNVKQAQLIDSINDQKDLIAIIQYNASTAAGEITRLEGMVQSLNAEISSLNEKYQARLAAEEAERARKAEEARRAAEAAAREATGGSNPQVYVPDNITYTPYTGDIVYYSQREEPWASGTYGTGWASSIAANGCGPTSMAMVLSTLTSVQVTPIDMAAYSMANGHCMPGDGGSFWSLFPAAAKKYGLTCKQTTNRQEIMDALSNGALVIASQNNALGNYWTYGGHFIVLTGVTESGNITVADPYSRGKTAISHSQDQVFIPMRSAWIIQK